MLMIKTSAKTMFRRLMKTFTSFVEPSNATVKKQIKKEPA
jgi:hypothetical protein